MIGFIKNLTGKGKNDFYLEIDDAASNIAQAVPSVATVKETVADAVETVTELVPDAVTATTDSPKEPVTSEAKSKSQKTPKAAPAPAPKPAAAAPKPAPAASNTFAPEFFGTTTTFTKKRKAGASLQGFRDMARKVGR